MDIIDKLEELNIIEKELGIPLTVIFKALKYGMYDETKKYRKVRSIDEYGLWVVDEGYPFPTFDDFYEYNDYGRTWALTKEELKCDSQQN